MAKSFKIHSDISVAETLPSSFYRDPNVFEKIKQNIFLKSWQFIGDNSQIKLNNSFMPQTILDGFLTEPIVITETITVKFIVSQMSVLIEVILLHLDLENLRN